jgi:hypothetical protein
LLFCHSAAAAAAALVLLRCSSQDMFNGVSKPLPLQHQLVFSKHHLAISFCCCCCCLGVVAKCSSQDMFNG